MAPVTHLPPPGPHLPWQTPCPFCPQARTPGPSSPDAGTRGGGGGSCTTKPRGSSQRKARPALRTLACVKAQHVMRVTVQLETLGLPPACSLPTVSLPASPHCAHTHTNPPGRLCLDFCSRHPCPDPLETRPSPASCLCLSMPCLGPSASRHPDFSTPVPSLPRGLSTLPLPARAPRSSEEGPGAPG